MGLGLIKGPKIPVHLASSIDAQGVFGFHAGAHIPLRIYPFSLSVEGGILGGREFSLGAGIRARVSFPSSSEPVGLLAGAELQCRRSGRRNLFAFKWMGAPSRELSSEYALAAGSSSEEGERMRIFRPHCVMDCSLPQERRTLLAYEEAALLLAILILFCSSLAARQRTFGIRRPSWTSASGGRANQVFFFGEGTGLDPYHTLFKNLEESIGFDLDPRYLTELIERGALTISAW